MIRYIRYIKLLLFPALSVLCLASCYHTDGEREICDYKVQLRYDYNEENTTTRNMIEYYVYTIDEYIFDSEGYLFQHRVVTPDRCTEYMNSEIDLPPGRYSVIAIGNQDERSRAYDAATNSAPVVKLTHRDNMRLSLENCGMHDTWTGQHGPSEKLYHGYKTFTVKQEGISRVRVDMINAHMTVKFRVTWRNGATPAKGNGYHAMLESIPSHYALMPQYIYPANSFECNDHDPDGHDLYPTNCNNVIHHIPNTCYEDANALAYRNNTMINGDNQMWGEFQTYRMKIDARPVLRILRTGGTRAEDTLIVPREIDLSAYLLHEQHQPDIELKQEYWLNIVIDGDAIIITPLDIADWDEGGMLG